MSSCGQFSKCHFYVGSRVDAMNPPHSAPAPKKKKRKKMKNQYNEGQIQKKNQGLIECRNHTR